MMTCRNCGAGVGADDKFCPICGITTAEEKAPRFCIHCGDALEKRDRFCQRCGAPVEKNAPDAASSRLRPPRLSHADTKKNTVPTASATVKNGKGRMITLITLMLVSAVFLLGGLLHWWHF